MTAIQGGKFWSGFAAGAVSSIVSSAMMGGDTTEQGFLKENNWAYGSRITHHQGIAAWAGMGKTTGTLAAAAISGGAASALAGGNFWQGAATGLMVAGANHLMDHQTNSQKFGRLPDKEDIAAFALTRRYRHLLYGPDAIAASANGNAGAGACVKLEKGALIVLQGKDAGQIYQYDDFGVGGSLASASANLSFTRLYYSGNNTQFTHKTFLGQRYELNAGIDVGVGVGITGIYAPLGHSEFVVGIGYSIGAGVSATLADFNLNYGTTSRTTPWKK